MAESVVVPIGIDTISDEEELPSKTYAMTLDTKRAVGVYEDGTEIVYHGRIMGYVDGQAAVQQAIRKALITPRFKCLIYDNQYGSQIEDAVTCNDATREYIRSVVPGFVEDCLKPDTRILGVSNFDFEFLEDGAYISFDADTIFGKVNVQEVI